MENFKEYSVAEFFKKNKQMLGFSGKVRSLTTIIHEYVTNSLDACEEHEILPNINIEITETGKDRYRVRFGDNGPGLPDYLIGKALGQMLAGTKFHRYMQQRGQQGIGAAGCTMYALITTGKPIKVISKYMNVITKCELSVDFKQNKPILKNVEKTLNTNGKTGLTIEAEFGDVKYERSIRGVYEYLKRTALSNPHCEITLKEPNGEIVFFPRSSSHIPQKPKEVLPHPLGVSAHDIFEFAKNEKQFMNIKTFLQNRFARVSTAKANEIEKMTGIDMKKHPNELTWEEAEKIKNAFKKIKWIAPAMDSVIPIGAEQIKKAMENILNPSFITVTSRKPKVFQGGIPFIVEVAIAYGGKEKAKIMRYANRVPLLFDASGCALTQITKSIDWKRYGIKNFDESGIVVFINLSSVHVPYTSAGKQSVANIEEINDEVKNAIQEAARSMNRYIRSVVREKERESKKRAIKRYITQLSKDLAELAGFGNKEEIAQKLNIIIERKYSLGGSNE